MTWRILNINPKTRAELMEFYDRAKSGACPLCNKDTTMMEFQDELSQKENYCSGLCQRCQNRFFNGRMGMTEKQKYWMWVSRLEDDIPFEKELAEGKRYVLKEISYE